MELHLDDPVNKTGPRDGACYVLRYDLKKEPMYCTEFAVSGRGAFPFDMLRSDMCHPIDAHSAGLIGMTRDHGDEYWEPRVIKLRTWSRNKFWRPTYDRWRSFGWIVTTDVTMHEVWP